MGGGGFQVGVGAGGLVNDQVRGEVVVGDRRRRLVQAVSDRVELAKVEPAAGTEQKGALLGPLPEIRKPVEGSFTGVDDVEALDSQGGRRRVDIGRHELGPGRQPDLGCQLLGGLDRRPGEIQADGLERRVHPHQVEGVQPKMALQVNEVQVAQRPQLVDFERLDLRVSGLEALDVVELGRHVQGYPLVPHASVGVHPPRWRCAHGGSVGAGRRSSTRRPKLADKNRWSPAGRRRRVSSVDFAGDPLGGHRPRTSRRPLPACAGTLEWCWTG